MKKVVLHYLVIAMLVVSAVFTSCGSSGSGGSVGGNKLSGTYVGGSRGESGSVTFSGNRMKSESGGQSIEGIYELVEEYNEDDFSRGKFILTHREGKQEGNYILEGKGIIFTFNGIIFIKQGAKSKESLMGRYVSGDNRGNTSSFVFFERNYSLDERGEHYEGIFKQYVLETKDNGYSSGILSFLKEDKTPLNNMRYVLEGNQLKLNGVIYYLAEQ